MNFQFTVFNAVHSFTNYSKLFKSAVNLVPMQIICKNIKFK